MSEANWEIHPEAVRVGASEHVHTHHLGAHHEQAIMYQHEGGNAAIEEGHDTIVPTLPPQEPYEELEDSSEYPTEQHHHSDERGEGVSTAKEGGEKDSMNTIQEKWAKHIEGKPIHFY